MELFLASIISSSIVSWPGKTSMVLCIAGCDFNCPYCYSSDQLERKEEFKVDSKQIQKEIKENREFVDAIVFSGGEPCLQRSALIQLIKYCKELKLKTGIETNGSNPDVLQQLLFENLVDFVGLDIKAPFEEEIFEKTTKSKTFFQSSKDILEKITQSLDLLKNSNVEKEIRTTIVPGLIYKKEDLMSIAQKANEARILWRLQKFRPDKGTILNKKYLNVYSPTDDFLEDIIKACKEHFPKLRITCD